MQISAILFNSKYTLTTINLYFKLMPPPGNGSYGKLSRSVVNNSSVDWTGGQELASKSQQPPLRLIIAKTGGTLIYEIDRSTHICNNNNNSVIISHHHPAHLKKVLHYNVICIELKVTPLHTTPPSSSAAVPINRCRIY